MDGALFLWLVPAPVLQKVLIRGNARTRSSLINQVAVVKRSVGLGGWHFLVSGHRVWRVLPTLQAAANRGWTSSMPRLLRSHAKDHPLCIDVGMLLHHATFQDTPLHLSHLCCPFQTFCLLLPLLQVAMTASGVGC